MPRQLLIRSDPIRFNAMRCDPLALPLVVCVASCMLPAACCMLQAAQVAYKNRIQFAKLAPLAGGSIGGLNHQCLVKAAASTSCGRQGWAGEGGGLS